MSNAGVGRHAGRVRWFCRLAVVCLVLVFIPGSGLAAPIVSPSAPFHEYSIAYESTSGGFTGVSSVRQDAHVGDQPSSNCSKPYASPVYQAEWIGNPDGNDWREIGTGHQCGDTYRYWYWGYGVDGIFRSLGYQTGVADGQSHTFMISNAFNGTANVFLFQIDGHTKASLTSSATFGTAQVGLESYDAPPTYINYFAITSLKAQRNGGSFTSWSGKDGFRVTGSAMCGKWSSATSWQAAEADPCA